MNRKSNESAAEVVTNAPTYAPTPQCERGHSLWEGVCEKCTECGREFDPSGLLIAGGRSEGDIDGWGNLC